MAAAMQTIAEAAGQQAAAQGKQAEAQIAGIAMQSAQFAQSAAKDANARNEQLQARFDAFRERAHRALTSSKALVDESTDKSLGLMLRVSTGAEPVSFADLSELLKLLRAASAALAVAL